MNSISEFIGHSIIFVISQHRIWVREHFLMFVMLKVALNAFYFTRNNLITPERESNTFQGFRGHLVNLLKKKMFPKFVKSRFLFLHIILRYVTWRLTLYLYETFKYHETFLGVKCWNVGYTLYDAMLICRLAGDLLLWEPVAPSPVERSDPCGYNIGAGLDLASQLKLTQGPDRFVMCRSGLHSFDDGKLRTYRHGARYEHGEFATAGKQHWNCSLFFYSSQKVDADIGIS